MYQKEIIMKKETTAPKAPRVTKKALMAVLEAKGEEKNSEEEFRLV